MFVEARSNHTTFGSAVCAENIINHAVVLKNFNGGGEVVVKCSEGSFVLGCGVKDREVSL